MKKQLKRMCTLAFGMMFLAAACGSLGMSPNAAYVNADAIKPAVTAASSGTAAPASICNPNKPELVLQYNKKESGDRYYESYNCFAAYPIRNVDQHATSILLGQYNGSIRVHEFQNIGYNEICRYIVLPNINESAGGKIKCIPTLYTICAECKSCGSYSSMNTQLTDTNNYGSSYFMPTGLAVSGTVPTSYQDSWRWKHNGADTIYFSIAYNGEAFGTIYDASLKVLLLGYKSQSVEVGGVTFTVRVGNTYVYLKASSPVAFNSYDAMFAFYGQP